MYSPKRETETLVLRDAYFISTSDVGAPTSIVGAEIREIAVSSARRMMYVRYQVYQLKVRQVFTLIRLLSLDNPSLQMEYLIPRLQNHDHEHIMYIYFLNFNKIRSLWLVVVCLCRNIWV